MTSLEDFVDDLPFINEFEQLELKRIERERERKEKLAILLQKRKEEEEKLKKIKIELKNEEIKESGKIFVKYVVQPLFQKAVDNGEDTIPLFLYNKEYFFNQYKNRFKGYKDLTDQSEIDKQDIRIKTLEAIFNLKYQHHYYKALEEFRFLIEKEKNYLTTLIFNNIPVNEQDFSTLHKTEFGLTMKILLN